MIETERLILRPWREADRASYVALHRSPAICRYLGGVHSDARIEEGIAGLKRSQARYGYGRWMIERRTDGRLLGVCGPRPYDRVGTPIHGEIEIGWLLADDLWGQGYAREAAQASLDWGWANLDVSQIVAITVPANTASWGLMERLGMIRRPDLDFGHPAFDPCDPLHHHIAYVAERPAPYRS